MIMKIITDESVIQLHKLNNKLYQYRNINMSICVNNMYIYAHTFLLQ